MATDSAARLLSRLEDILESVPQIDEIGFIHPMQFTAFTDEIPHIHSSSSVSGPHPEGDGFVKQKPVDNLFWHEEHKLGISTLVLVPLYRAARDAFTDAYNKRYVFSSGSPANEDEALASEVMKHSKALVLLSCDFGTAWNSRKLIVSKTHRLPMLMDELVLSALVLSCSPKSERAWTHRRWAIKMIIGKCANFQDLVRKESELVKTLAENSKMNYRAWNHRCWLVSYMSYSQVLLELNGSREWAGFHIADNSCFHYRSRLLLKTIESLRKKNDPDGWSGEDFHRNWKEELEWVEMLIKRYVGREALWLHRRFLSLVWMKQHSAADDDQSTIVSPCHSCCTSCDIRTFIANELMLFDSCINLSDDDFGDYRAQATYATTYILWLAMQMPMSFGVELRKSSHYEGRLRLLLDAAGKSCLWEYMAASLEYSFYP